MTETYLEARKRLRHQHNVGLITFIIQTFESQFGQQLKFLEKFRVVGENERITNVNEFCMNFYGGSDLEWVYIHFKSGVTVSLTKNGQFMEVRYNRTDHVRTSDFETIRVFLTRLNLITNGL